MTASQKKKILAALADKTNKVYYFDNGTYDIYDSTGNYIIHLDPLDVDALLFHKVIIMTGDETEKQIKELEELKAKNKKKAPSIY
ncbi:MAG: hypothetical protein BGO69_15765 [Bacteroidetes bacterium 46-16]|nr:MAG: hypothetical protein BGO69_15765 [Bacteroidetes bacterium 46-16]